MNRGKRWTFLGSIILIAAAGFGVTRHWLDPAAAATLIASGGYLVGAISREWFPPPHRRVGDPPDETEPKPPEVTP